MKLSNKFKSFFINLIKNYSNQIVSNLFQSFLKTGGNEDYLDFLANTLNLIQIKYIYEALRKRSFRKSMHIFRLLSAKEETIPVESMSATKKLEIIFENDQNNINQISQNANDLDVGDYSNHDKIDSNISYLSLFDYSSSDNQKKEESNCKLFIETRKNCINNSLMIFNKNFKSSISNKNHFNSDISFSTSSIDKFKASWFHTKFDLDTKRKERSPCPSSISKLNLFRNIFDDELQSYVFNSNIGSLTKTKSEEEEQKKYILKPNFQSYNKFHKLNDLVSVMINEEYFKA